MIFTLHRYIFRELIRVFLLSGIALTMIMSLGSILRPVQEYGVGPRQVIHLMGYFLPITLTFVLPMAALFSASLVYGRFAGDNELDACKASGISLPTLIYPGLALAIMVATANLIMSFYVMPAFVRRAEQSLKADAKQILFRNIQRKGYYELPDKRYRIYADMVDPHADMLLGVIVADSKGYDIGRIITAEDAKVRFNLHNEFNEAQILAHNTYQIGIGDEGGGSAEWLPLKVEFGSLLGDDIKFKKIKEMKKIRLNPMRFRPVANMVREVYAQLIVELLAQDISEKTAGRGGYELHSDNKFVEFKAGGFAVRTEKQVHFSGRTVVTEKDAAGKKPPVTFECTKALLHIEGDELAPTLTMELHGASWKQPGGMEGLSQSHIIRGLVLPPEVSDKLINDDLLNAVSPVSIAGLLRAEPTPILVDLENKLHRKIQRTMVEIDAEIHSRLVFGIGCVFLIIIGIGLGIIKKGGHMLSAFGVSSVPAAMLIVFIMMGKNITKNSGSLASCGILLMWAGLALLCLLAAGIYYKLAKN